MTAPVIQRRFPRRTHHRAYDTGKLELLPYLEPEWRDEVAHAVMHLGLIGAVRRLAPGRR